MSEPSTRPSDPMPLRSLQIIAGTFVTTLVLIAIIAVVVIGVETPESMWLIVLAVVAIACAGFLAVMGFTVQPIEPDDRTPERTALARFQASSILRLAVAETPGLFGLALAFVDGSALLSVLGSAVALVLIGVFAWPARHTISRLERVLDQKGARSRLSETLLGRQPGTTETSGGGYLPH